MSNSHSGNESDRFRNASIQLTSIEDTLRRLLLDVVSFIEQHPNHDHSSSQVALPPQLAGEKTVLRFTGGWVRDKLLGVESHDIDVAINNMTGYQFGLRMKEYLDQPGNLEKYDLDGVAGSDTQVSKAGPNGKAKLVGGLHKIEANPEKSKHLETVTTRIFGLDIDLVNLRKETYTDDSRNPQMEFGTPEEDALRRDATINAMFYNLNTLQIEDFTSRGFDDMAQKIIRTPLEPHQTFKDDPLRVLRLIRFASRLGYHLDPTAAESMKNDDIKAALKVKISRERVGVELEKMLRGPDPRGALRMINDAGLYSTVFSDPTVADSGLTPEVDTWPVVLDTVAALLDSSNTNRSLFIYDAEEAYIAWVLACMVPYRNAPALEAKPGKKPPPPIATQVAREGFKATNKVSEIITLAVGNSPDLVGTAAMYDRPHTQNSKISFDTQDRQDIGMEIRRLGSTWRLQAIYAMLSKVADEPSEAEFIISIFVKFLERVEELGLSNAFSMKPLLDGKQLATAIGISPGPWMKEALEVVVAWQLRNPGNENALEAVEDVKSKMVHGELAEDLIKHFLTLTIRPLFAKNQHPALTTQGRKNLANTAPRGIDITFDEAASKPWKKPQHQIFDILSWIMSNLDSATVEQHWHMLVPPLLSIVDDSSVPIKTRGCELISMLLQKTPSSLLSRTGLFDVFHEALMPCFGFLPTLTPEAESAALLSHTFPALLALHHVRFPNTPDAPDITRSEQSVLFLDDIIRRGVFATFSHCSEYVQLSTVILQSLPSIIDALGFESIKHLKHSLPLLNEVLCNPFGAASPELLRTALIALQSVIRSSQPCLTNYRGEVLKGLCVAWINVVESDHQERFEDFCRQALLVVDMLREASDDKTGLEADLQILISADDRLQTLLARV